MAIYSGMLDIEAASRVVIRLPSLSSVKAATRVSKEMSQIGSTRSNSALVSVEQSSKYVIVKKLVLVSLVWSTIAYVPLVPARDVSVSELINWFVAGAKDRVELLTTDHTPYWSYFIKSTLVA